MCFDSTSCTMKTYRLEGETNSVASLPRSDIVGEINLRERTLSKATGSGSGLSGPLSGDVNVPETEPEHRAVRAR